MSQRNEDGEVMRTKSIMNLRQQVLQEFFLNECSTSYSTVHSSKRIQALRLAICSV